jgi:SHS family lactate transporter-like MFS transporter
MTTTPWWKEPTRAQWSAFLAAWSGWVLDAFDFTIFFLVMKHIGEEFGVGAVATNLSLAITLLARLVGGIAAGSLADRFGRRLPLMLSVLGFSICDGLVAAAPSFAFILVMRTLFGFFMGAEWTAGTTLAMESWPERSRGIASGILQGSWAIGYLLATPVYQAVMPRWGWRGLFVVAAVPALLVLPIRFFVRESADFERRARAPRTSIRQMIAVPGWTRAVAWSTAVMACGFGVFYAMAGNYPLLLQTELGAGPDVPALIALFNVGMLLGSIVTGLVASRRGVIVAVVVPALAMVPLVPLYVGAAPGLLHLGAFLGGAIGVGFCGVTPFFLTSLFPADIRARSVGLVYNLGAIPAAFVSAAVAALARYSDLSLAASMGLVVTALELLLVMSILIARFRFGIAAPAAAAVADDGALLRAVQQRTRAVRAPLRTAGSKGRS